MTSSVFSDVDEYGFKRPENFDHERYEKFMSSYLIILTNRSKKWFRLMKNPNLKKGGRLKRYILKGIPSVYRGQVWVQISKIDQIKVQYGCNLYQKRLNTVLESDVMQAIRTDLPRTFPNNIYFLPVEGCQEQLYRILFAFAVDNHDIGYCQGLNYIAGLLLLVTKEEETTFWLLKVITEKILPDYYTKSMRGLKVDIEVLTSLIKYRIPELYKHIRTLNIPWSLLVMKWFICLYAEVLPAETVLRIWDCLFYQYSKVIFRVAFTLINYHHKTLLECSDFTSFVNFFGKMAMDGFVLDCHGFMKKVDTDGKFITNKKLEKLRRQAKLDK